MRAAAASATCAPGVNGTEGEPLSQWGHRRRKATPAAIKK